MKIGWSMRAMISSGTGNFRWKLLLGVAAALIVSVGAVAAVWFGSRPDPGSPATTAPTAKPGNDQSRTPLTVRIGGVTEGQEVQGEIPVTTETDETSRIDRAELYVDDMFAAITYAPPFNFTLDTTKLDEGRHVLLIKLYDKNGDEFSSKTVTIFVKAPEVGTAESTGTAAGGSRTSTTTTTGNSTQSTGSGSGTTNQTPGTDTAAPTAPGSLMLSANDGYTTNLSWQVSSDNVGVSGYRVYRDGTLLGSVLGASTTTYRDQTVVPGNTYEYAVAAIDAATNVSSFSNEPSVTLVPTSIWINGDTPQNIDTDPSAIELGVKFRPLVNGMITGIKFYKGAGNTGTHTGTLWSNTGTNLASVTFSGESTTGWQQATFSSPVSVTAGTTYVASYTAPNGHLSYTSGYFTTDGITSQYLTAPADGVVSGNGVFSSPGAFPATPFSSTNYWVDVLFIPHAGAGGPTATVANNSQTFTGFPGSNNTGVPVGKRLPQRDRNIEVYQNDTMVENIAVTGDILVRAEDVTIRNSKVNGLVNLDPDLPGSSLWSFVLEDSEVDAGTSVSAAVSSARLTITRANVHGGQHSVLCSGECTIQDSWLHDQYVYGSGGGASHNNAFLSNGGSNMTITHNTLACNSPANGTGGGCSGDVSLFGDFSAVTDVTIDGSLFTASVDTPFCFFGGYQTNKVYGQDTENVIVTNNTFQRGSNNLCGTYGPVTNFLLDETGLPAPGNVWTNNKWDDGTTVSSSG